MTWQCELWEAREPTAPDIWRVFDDSDDSFEATICLLGSGENDNEELAKEICRLHNESDDVDAEIVKCCKTCRFWHLKENKICGQCRRFPPARDHQEILYGWSFPVTHPAEWCGEWREIIDHV